MNTFAFNFRMARNSFLRKPRFLLRVIRNYALAILPGTIKPLRFADVSVTHTCNLKCVHCSEQGLRRDAKDALTIEEYKLLAQKLIDEGILIFHFTGGEPLMRKDLEDVIRAFQPDRCMISIQSNSSLATRERLQSLWDAGLDLFCVSIDGDEWNHDLFRQSAGSYAQCWETAKIAAEIGLRVSISTVITHRNVRSPMLEQLIIRTGEMGANCFFNLPVPVGRFQNNVDDLFTADDRKYMEGLIKKYPHCRTDFESCYYKQGCSALKEKFYITPEGDIIPCPFIQIVCGNVRVDSIKDIRINGIRKIPELAQYLTICPAAEDRDFQIKYNYFTDAPLIAGQDPATGEPILPAPSKSSTNG